MPVLAKMARPTGLKKGKLSTIKKRFTIDIVTSAVFFQSIFTFLEA